MARMVVCHPSQTKHAYHVYTDLDFWDARKILKDIAIVRRNFGSDPSGDVYPTQVIADDASATLVRKIEKRLKRAIVSPPRHVVVHEMILNGTFEFDPQDYYPRRWSRERMMHFTFHRMPLQQSSLSNQYQMVVIDWREGRIRLERVQRDARHNPVIHTAEEARKLLHVPSCF